jgi:hypothetical protein
MGKSNSSAKVPKIQVYENKMDCGKSQAHGSGSASAERLTAPSPLPRIKEEIFAFYLA